MNIVTILVTLTFAIILQATPSAHAMKRKKPDENQQKDGQQNQKRQRLNPDELDSVEYQYSSSEESNEGEIDHEVLLDALFKENASDLEEDASDEEQQPRELDIKDTNKKLIQIIAQSDDSYLLVRKNGVIASLGLLPCFEMITGTLADHIETLQAVIKTFSDKKYLKYTEISLDTPEQAIELCATVQTLLGKSARIKEPELQDAIEKIKKIGQAIEALKNHVNKCIEDCIESLTTFKDFVDEDTIQQIDAFLATLAKLQNEYNVCQKAVAFDELLTEITNTISQIQCDSKQYLNSTNTMQILSDTTHKTIECIHSKNGNMPDLEVCVIELDAMGTVLLEKNINPYAWNRFIKKYFKPVACCILQQLFKAPAGQKSPIHLLEFLITVAEKLCIIDITAIAEDIVSLCNLNTGIQNFVAYITNEENQSIDLATLVALAPIDAINRLQNQQQSSLLDTLKHTVSVNLDEMITTINKPQLKNKIQMTRVDSENDKLHWITFASAINEGAKRLGCANSVDDQLSNLEMYEQSVEDVQAIATIAGKLSDLVESLTNLMQNQSIQNNIEQLGLLLDIKERLSEKANSLSLTDISDQQQILDQTATIEVVINGLAAQMLDGGQAAHQASFDVLAEAFGKLLSTFVG